MAREFDNPIDLLGGISRTRQLTGQPYNVVWNWHRRGVPWRWRPMIAELLRDEGKVVPPDFLRPDIAA